MTRIASRAERPVAQRMQSGEEAPKAYLVGGGIASMAAAAFLIHDGDVLGRDITILEESDVIGGSLDGSGMVGLASCLRDRLYQDRSGGRKAWRRRRFGGMQSIGAVQRRRAPHTGLSRFRAFEHTEADA